MYSSSSFIPIVHASWPETLSMFCILEVPPIMKKYMNIISFLAMIWKNPISHV